MVARAMDGECLSLELRVKNDVPNSGNAPSLVYFIDEDSSFYSYTPKVVEQREGELVHGVA